MVHPTFLEDYFFCSFVNIFSILEVNWKIVFLGQIFKKFHLKFLDKFCLFLVKKIFAYTITIRSKFFKFSFRFHKC